MNHIGGVMIIVLASSVVDRGFEPRSDQSSVVDGGFEPRSGQTKDYIIGICCFSAKHAELRRKSKDWLTRNQNNVSEWSDMSTRDCCFSELALEKSNSASRSITQRTSLSFH
jgi:hypothetical protein